MKLVNSGYLQADEKGTCQKECVSIKWDASCVNSPSIQSEMTAGDCQGSAGSHAAALFDIRRGLNVCICVTKPWTQILS